MKNLLIRIIKKTPLYHPLRNWNFKKREQTKLAEWARTGKPVPPPHIVKQQTLKTFAKQFGLKVLVETGTFYGDMVNAMKKDFDQIYSIELSEELYEKARKRFKGERNIHLICGNSGVELRSVCSRMNQPTLFWLDSHYSSGVTDKGDKDTPIYEELGHIFNIEDKGHVIIIDDARCFGTDPAYPSIEELTVFIKSERPNANITILNDSIRITLQ